MNLANRPLFLLASCALLVSTAGASAQDWPQWRGTNREAKAAGFTAPKTWPKELTQKWKVTVGDGVATPSLVGDKLYVFSRQEGREILRCLEVATGKELWQEQYDALGASGPASGFSGPRCSPTVAEGKAVTLGVRGVLSCLDAESGKLLWRKDDFPGALPRFFTSASPIVVDGLCVAELGGDGKGGIIGYDLATGAEKWTWTGDSPAYASPTLMTVDGTKLVIAQTEFRMVALALGDGKLAWETPFAVQGRGYNASSPVVEGQTLIYSGSGRGTTAVRIEKEGDGFVAKPLWKNSDISVQFNSPVLKDGFLYGLTGGNDLFCINATDGKTAWTAPAAGVTPAAPPAPGAENPPGAPAPGGPDAAPGSGPARGPGGFGGGPGGGRGMRGGGGGGRGGGYGNVVDAGSVLFALTPASQLIAFAPGGTAYTELARIKVASTPTHAYPVISGNRIFTKDQDSVTLWTVE
jgi:glucose dehydrogenase